MKKQNMLIIIFCLVNIFNSNLQGQTILWSEDFEGDWTLNWYVDNGTWEVGVPTSGPGSAYNGTKCAATVLAGNYPPNANTRLIRTSFTIPAGSENPRLRFWHWFSISTADYGKVQIKPTGSPDWIDLSEQYLYSGSDTWSCSYLDLSDFAGQTVQIAFYFFSDGSPYSLDVGWYIDDVSIVTGPVVFNNPEGWENGIGDWSSENGTWETGVPTSGPDIAHSGQKCAATHLAGIYSSSVDSRLVSPDFIIPEAAQNPRLRFWHWFSISTADYGKVQIKPTGSPDRIDLSEQYLYSGSDTWSCPYLDLSDFAGQTVQIAFYFFSDGSPYSLDVGWYIDDVSIVTGPVVFNNPEGWENGIGDWKL